MQYRWALGAALLAVLSGCGVVREARMAQPASLAAVKEESFGKPGWGRRGEFELAGQRVRYDRGADRLSLFDTLTTGRAPLRFTWSTPAGDSEADCTARQTEVTAGVLALATKPWTLNCRWRGASDAVLQIGEGRVQWGQQTREGSYQRGALNLTLRSVHQLEGSALATAGAVGYEMLHGGQVVGSVDLSRGVPYLRRPDPGTALGQAVTEAALALALVWEPQG
ncbi:MULTISPECIES: hypothetical protein [unclassified Roseateles]|uniref:hypothetical protein n=1 Tax=unclassified Roseateles TaxID=2626991 RepID=UPI0006F7A51B|nr:MULTISPECIES: hypothetical protein [unclassified Roseateles]KQW51642.1 hypothetical protein ASC81_03170 [Pelomonas sp. Root405]KRA77875.1 hypothetical protein ASD88_03170 [Pelomonas sp. Root662]